MNLSINPDAEFPKYLTSTPNPPSWVTPAQESMIELLIQQIKQTIINDQGSRAQFLDQDIKNLIASFASQGGPLSSVGITDPAEIAQITTYIEQAGGYSPTPPPPTNPVEAFIDQLTVLENNPSTSAAEKQLIAQILSNINNNMKPEAVQEYLQSLFNSKQLLGYRDIYFEFPGISPSDLQAIANLLPGYKVAIPTPSTLDNALINCSQISDPYFRQLILEKLESYDNSNLTDQQAFADFQNYVQNTIFNDPKWSQLSSADQTTICNLANLPIPGGGLPGNLTPDQQANINNLLQELEQTMANYLKALSMTTGQQNIQQLQNSFQKIIDGLLGPNGSFVGLLKSYGITDPNEISSIITYLKKESGLNYPLNDPVWNFVNYLKNLEQTGTSAEQAFANKLLALIQSQTKDGNLPTPSQLQSDLNQILQGDGHRDVYFEFPGITPDDLNAIAGALYSPLTLTVPRATNLDAALYMLENSDLANTPIGKEMINKLLSYDTSSMSADDAFADFHNFVVNNILPNMSNLSPSDQQLIQQIANCNPVAPNNPIDPSNGSAQFTYNNNSGVDDSQVYITVVGVDPNTGKQCFIKYNPDGTFSYVDVPLPPGTDPKQFAFPLSYFDHSANGTGRSIRLPEGGGMRIYTSIDQPLTFGSGTDAQGNSTIIAPDPHNPNDPNASIHWDKTEFNVSGASVFINPTAVDDFSLPIQVQETDTSGNTQTGGIDQNWQEVYAALQAAFAQAAANGDPAWEGLINGNTVFSPMNGAASGDFPSNYFVTSGWLQQFESVFSQNALKVDAGESIPGAGEWDGKVDPATGTITFTSKNDPNNYFTLKIPTNTQDILSGIGDTDPSKGGWTVISSHGNVPLDLVKAITRNVSCAIDTNTLTTTGVLSQAYFESCKNDFYQADNPIMGNHQFVDYYSKVLHQFAPNGQIYTFPYDDELDQSGGFGLNPNDFSSGSITLGPLS